jgi:hypothetical protein
MGNRSTTDTQGVEPSCGVRVPTTANLFEALENILWFWPGVFVQLVKEDPKPVDFDLTRSVRLSGQYEGWVVLKTSKPLGTILAKSLVGDAPTPSEDAFNEFSNMFCGHIMNNLRASNQAVFRHFLPMEELESKMPSRSPDACITVAIQHVVLHVQLWVDRVNRPVEKVD